MRMSVAFSTPRNPPLGFGTPQTVPPSHLLDLGDGFTRQPGTPSRGRGT